MNINKNIDVSLLVNELCSMTGCDQEQALMYLSSCDFDVESAANKILESSSDSKHAEDEWQIINRQKKVKNKSEIIDSEQSGDTFRKAEPYRAVKFKAHNKKNDHFKSEDKLNNNRPRNRRNRVITRNTNENLATHNMSAGNKKLESFEVTDSENELRWDNVGDIDGTLKKVNDHIQVDGFYSDDDFGFSTELDDQSFRGLSTQLVSDIHQKYKARVNTSEDFQSPNPEMEIPAQEKSYSSIPESQVINECLTNQLPIFGKFSKTEAPQALSFVPDKPVSFFRSVKPKNTIIRWRYNFGINIKAEVTGGHLNEPSYNVFNDAALQISDQSKILLRNQIPPSNVSNLNQSFLHNPDYTDILNTIFQQQKVVAAMILGNPPPQNYFELPKSLNMISMAGSNHMEPMYSMNMHTTGLHPNIENGINIQSQDGFVTQSTYPTSTNVSVPFHSNRKFYPNNTY